MDCFASSASSSSYSVNNRLYGQTTHSSRGKVKTMNYSSSEDTLPMARPQQYEDSLDLALATCYDQSQDLFAEKHEIHIQGETLMAKQKLCERTGNFPATTTPFNYRDQFKNEKPHSPALLIGGIRERTSPHSVKLINVGQHTPLTNPGYSRQTSDGNVFNY